MKEFVRVDHMTPFSVGSFTRASMLTGIRQEDIQVMPQLCTLIAEGVYTPILFVTIWIQATKCE